MVVDPSEGWTVDQGGEDTALFVVPITLIDPDIGFYADHFVGVDHTNYIGRWWCRL